MKPTAQPPQTLPPLEVFSADELDQLYQQIVDSGVLGRSRVYASLLRYLLNHSTSGDAGRPPKEIEIAIDVLGRDSDFDVSKDSVVRVYVHQLRKKLDNFYVKSGRDAAYRIVIPKGQYTVAAQATGEISADSDGRDPQETTPGTEGVPRMRQRLAGVKPWLLLGMLVLLIANAVLLSLDLRDHDHLRPDLAAAQNHPMWQSILEDDIPILVVMGDYYIFGELDERGRLTRMVREFDINSERDFIDHFTAGSGTGSDNTSAGGAQYRNLDMTYLPAGGAYALSQLMPILQTSGKRIKVTMMSQLSSMDLRSHHIVYIGYISAMDKLASLYFGASGLQPGPSYDVLLNGKTDEFYTSTAGQPAQGEPFRDLALLATFPAANSNQYLLITGTRDAGLMHAAKVATSGAALGVVDHELNDPGAATGYEALFEVFGLDKMNFEARLLYTQALDPSRMWAAPEQE